MQVMRERQLAVLAGWTSTDSTEGVQVEKFHLQVRKLVHHSDFITKFLTLLPIRQTVDRHAR